jgi:hypothetical protein
MRLPRKRVALGGDSREDQAATLSTNHPLFQGYTVLDAVGVVKVPIKVIPKAKHSNKEHIRESFVVFCSIARKKVKGEARDIEGG